LDIFVSNKYRRKFWKGSKCGMEANPKDDFGYWIDTNPEEAFSPQTEQVDKDMMIFINS
jgi:hypothetical protein